MDWDRVLDVFFDMVQDIVESITLPTGNSLVPTFIYSAIIAVASVVSRFISPITFIDWRGALIATVLLLILAVIEGRGVNEVSRLYRVVKTGTAALKERTKRPGSALEAPGGTNPGDEVPEEVGEPSDGTGEM